MMQQATDAQSIPCKCFGSVKGHHAIQVSLAGCLVADVAMQWQAPLALVHADVTSCYDNIAHSPGSIACQ